MDVLLLWKEKVIKSIIKQVCLINEKTRNHMVPGPFIYAFQQMYELSSKIRTDL